jgi:16S rRNA (guanine966-N2)-methyltransferase
MRVIAGSLGGRLFDSPRTPRTHPMSDKARGGLFNTLGDIKGMSVLDAFAGSGAIAIEAVSRGAERVVAIDVDKDAFKTVVANIRVLQLEDQIEAVRRQAGSWSTGHTDIFFDVVVCDPPYDNLRRDILQKVALRTKQEGIFILSWPGHEPAPVFTSLKFLRQKSYGDIQLIYYQKY